jgi:hypothetical protein
MLALMLAAALSASDDAPRIDLDRPLTSMSRAQLQREYARVEEARPGVGGPVAMMSIGGGLMLVSAYFFFITATSSFGGLSSVFSNGNVAGYLFVAVMMAGAALLVPGIWMLGSRREERAQLGDRLDQINARMEELDRADSPRRRGRARVDDYGLYEPPPTPPASTGELPPQL